jgi:peptidyl-tRNA hydrolase, PTH1 family
MKVVVGLGNPGEKYKNTRHNFGFLFLDFLSKENWDYNKKFNADISEQGLLTLIKPMTFMNNSGQAVRSFFDYYKILPKKLGFFVNKNSDLNDQLIVVHDDLDIDFGKYKISKNISSAGHKGVESIINNLKTKNFTRIRLGIKNDKRSIIPGHKFVLQNFSEDEKGFLDNIFKEIENEVF